MATVGSISVAFEADSSGLQSGIDSIVASLERLSATVNEVSERMSSLSVSTASLDSATDSFSSLDRQVKEVSKSAEQTDKSFQDLSDSIEETTSGSKELTEEIEETTKGTDELRKTVQQASSSFAVLFSRQASASVRAYGKELKDIGIAAKDTLTPLSRAARAVIGLLSGRGLNVDGLITAIGRSKVAWTEVAAVLASVGAATGAFIRYSGGARVILSALSGNAASMTRVFAAAGAAVAVAGTGLAVYAGVVAAARLATRSLSDESQGYVVQATRAVTATTVLAASVYMGNVAFRSLYEAMRTSNTVAEAFARVAGSATSSAAAGFSTVVRSIEKINILLNVAKVASGAYRQELALIAGESNSIQDMADRFGSTTQELQLLARSARDAGVSMGVLAKAQQNLFTSLSKIRIGQINTESTREAKIAFDRLNISIEDLRSKRPQEIFELIAARLTAVEDASDRSAIAFDLFGKQGAMMLPALKNLKEIQADAARLGTTLNSTDFSALNKMSDSFNRVREASKNLSQAFLIPLAPIQTGWNNFIADVQGGLAVAFGPIASVMAKAVVPFQVFLEVTGRVANMLLRLVGAAAKAYAALVLPENTLAGPWKVLGSAIMDVLGFIESGIEVIEQFADAFLTELTPAVDDFMQPAKTFSDWLAKIGTFAGYFALVVGAISLTSTAFQTMAIASGTAAAATAGSAGLISTAYSLMSRSVIASLSAVKAALGITTLPFEGLAVTAIRAFKVVVVGATEMASTFVTRMAVMGLSALQGWIAPFLAGVASFVTGTTVASTAAAVSATAMAAAWVVATLGLAAIVVAIVAVVQNFDSLYDYFSNFTENVSRLFTWEGLTEAVGNVADAIAATFRDLAGRVGGFVSRMVAGVFAAFTGIKPAAEIEKIDAAVAEAEEVARKRREVAQANWERSQASAVQFNQARASMSLGIVPEIQIAPPPVDETESLVVAIKNARDEMSDLTVEAGNFGAAGKSAVSAAQEQFAKLQQQLSEGTLSPAGADERGLSDTALFEKRAQKIRDDLRRNLDLSNVLSVESVNEFSQAVAKSIDSLQTRFDKLARGSDLGSTFSTSRFFPSTSEIRQEAKQVLDALAAEERAIAKRLAEGGFGRDADATKRAQAEVDDARFKAEVRLGKVEADISFANDIRKSLEEAFLSPVDKFEKRVKEIEANKSLSALDKSLATVEAQQQLIESTFGKTAGESLREREEVFEAATKQDRFGRTAFMSSEGTMAGGEARAAMERNRLDMQRRQAAGLEATPGQMLQDGVNSINDVFGVLGLTLEEIQEKLDPEKFAEYQEAQERNRDSILESLGVQRSGIKEAAELAAKLRSAGASAEETAFAMRRQSESFMQSLGVQMTPFEQYSSSIENIASRFGMAGKSIDQIREALRGSPEQLALFDRAIKQSADNLLERLGVQKSPEQQLTETLKEIQEASQSGAISLQQANEARIRAFQQRDESLGAGDNTSFFRFQFDQNRRNISEAFGSNGEKNPERFALAMEKLRTSIPGAEPTSPVVQFRQQLEKLNSIRGQIGEDAFQQSRLGLQAQLEDSIGGALDKVAPDRRQVGAADARSREGVDTFFRILQGRDNPSLKAQLEIARNTRLLAEAANDPDAAPIIANFAAR